MGLFKKVKKVVGGNTIGGAAIGLATGGLAGAAIGAGAGLYSDYENYQAQKAQDKATEKSNAYQKYLWDLTNQYNDPKAQMERLKGAGLNPNLVYGSGNVTGNTAGIADSTAYSAAGRSDAIGRGLQVASAMANLKQTENQGELLKYQMGQTAAQTEYARLRAKDLSNFLTGSGPTTYRDPMAQYRAPSANPTTTPEEEPSLSDVIVSLAPNADARDKTRKYLKKSGITDKVADFLFPVYDKIASLFYPNPEDMVRHQKEILRKKSLDNDFKSGRISRREYINELAL